MSVDPVTGEAGVIPHQFAKCSLRDIRALRRFRDPVTLRNLLLGQTQEGVRQGGGLLLTETIVGHLQTGDEAPGLGELGINVGRKGVLNFDFPELNLVGRLTPDRGKLWAELLTGLATFKTVTAAAVVGFEEFLAFFEEGGVRGRDGRGLHPFPGEIGGISGCVRNG